MFGNAMSRTEEFCVVMAVVKSEKDFKILNKIVKFIKKIDKATKIK